MSGVIHPLLLFCSIVFSQIHYLVSTCFQAGEIIFHHSVCMEVAPRFWLSIVSFLGWVLGFFRDIDRI
jgi:hypothetical protein